MNQEKKKKECDTLNASISPEQPDSKSGCMEKRIRKMFVKWLRY